MTSIPAPDPVDTPDPTTPKLDPTAFIRTYVPWAVGAILGFLVVHIPAVATAIDWLNALLKPAGIDVQTLLNGAAIFGVMALYYWIARKVGQKFPKVEAILLGSSATPTYVK